VGGIQLIDDQLGSTETFVDEGEDRADSHGAAESAASLRIVGITKSLGDAQILKSVSLDAAAGRITGIIGPNGAGKSTLLNIVGGLIRPDEGRILIGDRDLTLLSMQKRARLGIVRTFQLSRELGELTVLENLLVAPLDQSGERVINAFFGRPRFRAEERAAAEQARRYLRKVGLWALADAPARTLSGGQKKLLELSRALMLDPKIILLDEPAAGVSPPLREEISRMIQDLRDEGKTLLIVEHDMDVVARLCDQVYVLAEGANLTSGRFPDVVSDERVIQAYLGGVA
jgi:ABC-type branched-subunit amino acid transport system ATPase component